MHGKQVKKASGKSLEVWAGWNTQQNSSAQTSKLFPEVDDFLTQKKYFCDQWMVFFCVLKNHPLFKFHLLCSCHGRSRNFTSFLTGLTFSNGLFPPHFVPLCKVETAWMAPESEWFHLNFGSSINLLRYGYYVLTGWLSGLKEPV